MKKLTKTLWFFVLHYIFFRVMIIMLLRISKTCRIHRHKWTISIHRNMFSKRYVVVWCWKRKLKYTKTTISLVSIITNSETRTKRRHEQTIAQKKMLYLFKFESLQVWNSLSLKFFKIVFVLSKSQTISIIINMFWVIWVINFRYFCSANIDVQI